MSENYLRLDETNWIVENSFLWEYGEYAFLAGAAQGRLGALGEDCSFYYAPDRL